MQNILEGIYEVLANTGHLKAEDFMGAYDVCNIEIDYTAGTITLSLSNGNELVLTTITKIIQKD